MRNVVYVRKGIDFLHCLLVIQIVNKGINNESICLRLPTYVIYKYSNIFNINYCKFVRNIFFVTSR